MDRDPMELAVSTDVVMDNILKHLKVTDLLNCREVSKFWNRAASSVLRRRSAMIRRLYLGEEDLMNLEKCIKESSDFPFAGLQFHELARELRGWCSGSGAMQFFQNYGDRFTRLRLDAILFRRLQDEAPFINDLTRLSILEFRAPLHYTWPMPLLDYAAVPAVGKTLKLPSVRTIRINWPCMGFVNEEILGEILKAASPAVQIECQDVSPGILRALQSAGRLRAVSVMEFYSAHTSDRNKWRTEMDQLLSTESSSLTKLALHGCGFDGLEKLLISSQHSLKELHLNVSWLEYSWDQFPVLTNLTKLSLLVVNNIRNVSLFRGKHGHKFPTLKELHLCLDCGMETGIEGPGYSSGLFAIPSVTRIDLKGYVDEDGMEQLSQSFPNIADIGLDYRYYSGDLKPGGRNPLEIWNVGKFKSLDKLRIWNFVVKQPSNDYINMDGFLTGIPVEICQNLHQQKQLDLNSQVKVLRDNPCILQLQNLKELVVCVKPGRELTVLSEDAPFMSMVSVWYALEMMPNLRAKFVHELSIFEQPKKSMLEAAFMHVQPSIKLEPAY